MEQTSRTRLARFVPLLLGLGGAAIVAVDGAQAFARPTPAIQESEPVQPTPEEVAARVDALMAQTWKQDGVKPVGPSSDATFLRRVSLDLTGVIPTEAEARAFLRDASPNKRQALIRHLLHTRGYAQTMALRWAYLLVGRDYLIRLKTREVVQKARHRRAMLWNRRVARNPSMSNRKTMADPGPAPEGFIDWLAARFKKDTPWTKTAADLIDAKGRVDRNPAVHYTLKHLRSGKASDLAGSVMDVFEGLQIQCAQCHDHPFDRWKRRQFWGVTAYFVRTAFRRSPAPAGATTRQPRKKLQRGKKGKKAKKRRRPRGPFMVFDRPRGQERIPAVPGKLGPLVLPQFLTGWVTDPGPGVDRREALARLITARQNPWFAKAAVNRVWSFFFGHGIIDPVDAVNQKDYPFPKVLQLLVQDFKANGYSIRRLCRILVNTRAYQLDSAGPLKTRVDQLALFARAPLRTLTAEQLFYSVCEATGLEDIHTRNRAQRRRIERMKFLLLRQFVNVFNDDEMQEVVEKGTIPQALMRLNGPLTNEAVRPRPGHPVYDRLFRMKSLAARIDTLYLRILSRYPTHTELVTLKKVLKPDRPAEQLARTYADVCWALLNGSEFNLNH